MRAVGARQSRGARTSGPSDVLSTILGATRSVMRTHERVELPRHGIDLLFDEGIVARCRACDISWRVSRSRFSQVAWWACPRGCPSDLATADSSAPSN